MTNPTSVTANHTDADPLDVPPKPKPAPWPTLDDAALHGLPGDVVRAIAPYSEADPVALLITFLIEFGNAVGPGPHANADAAHHPARLFGVLVGETARGRKGTAQRNVHRIFEQADPEWAGSQVVGGLGSGEGLIAAVADREKDDEDSGPWGAFVDKRVLVLEEEFARVLAVAGRAGSVLSEVLRQAWDGGDLRVTTRRNPLQASGAHISVIGHITLPELSEDLDKKEALSGFGNRFLWVCVKRAKRLPSGAGVPEDTLRRLGERTTKALSDARKIDQLHRDKEAEDWWAELYEEMAAEDLSWLVDALIARAEAQVLRLSGCYALCDGSKVITKAHLEAAWAVWRYCEASARFLFGHSLRDPIADQLYRALLAAGMDGLDGTEQMNLFSRNVPAQRLALARETLERMELVTTTNRQQGRGRPRRVTVALETYERNEANEEKGAE